MKNDWIICLNLFWIVYAIYWKPVPICELIPTNMSFYSYDFQGTSYSNVIIFLRVFLNFNHWWILCKFNEYPILYERTLFNLKLSKIFGKNKFNFHSKETFKSRCLYHMFLCAGHDLCQFRCRMTIDLNRIVAWITIDWISLFAEILSVSL